MTISDLFDFSGFITFLGILIFSIILYYKIARTSNGIDKIASLTFYISLSVSLIYIVRALTYFEGVALFGPALAFSLLLLFYASSLKMLAMIFCRFQSASTT